MRFKTTCSERIPNVIFSAGAGRYVVSNSAVCIDSTRSRTRVYTLGPQTSFVRRTVAVDDTLRPAGDVRVSEVLRDTLTCCSSSLRVTDSVGAAG